MVKKVLCILLSALIVSPNVALWAESGQRSKAASKAASRATKKKPAPKSKKKIITKRTVRRRAKINYAARWRMRRAFVASNSLRPMAQQLIQNRTRAAYAGVEAYARKHGGTDEGAMAWLAVGYAHLLDQDYAQSIAALEKAKKHAGELADYVRYFEAKSYAGMGRQDEVVAVLKDFQQNMPDSIFTRDVVSLYGNALVAQGSVQDAIQFLEAHRLPMRSDIELALGSAYLKTDQPQNGMEILRRIYFAMPTSPVASVAATQLQAQGGSLTGTFSEERMRAELLQRANRWSDAASEYRKLLGEAPAAELGNVQVWLGAALRRTGNKSEAKQLLQNAQVTGETNAVRLYNLGEIARSDDDVDAVMANLARMRQETPSSPWYEAALLSAGNMYLLKKDYDNAIAEYRELYENFPRGSRAAYAHWKATWLLFRLNRMDDAKRELERQVSLYPSSQEMPAALYWRARLAEEDGNVAMARAWYGELSRRFRNYYYGDLARNRLAKLPRSSRTTTGRDMVLNAIPAASPLGPDVRITQPPTDDLRYEKAELLANAGLTDFAVKELQMENGGGGANWATLQVAKIYRMSGQDYRALQFVKRAVPGYYSLEVSQLPRPYWDALFPRPFWTELRRYAAANRLDPYLVAALIRQESEFNPGAVSRANALGLMQLLPRVGRGEARELHLWRYSTRLLLTPAVNLRLGTRYFRKMIDEYNGRVEYALAAYNAGTNRVDDWLAAGNYRDNAEFVESIPFTETREYVQAILRNADIYRQLYAPKAGR